MRILPCLLATLCGLAALFAEVRPSVVQPTAAPLVPRSVEARQAPPASLTTVLTEGGTPTTVVVAPSPTGLGACHLHIDHWDCEGQSAETHEHEHEGDDAGHEGHDHAVDESADSNGDHDHGAKESADSHAGHSHGPSAEFGCGLTPLEDYNLGLHIAAVFVLLVGSSVGTFLPIMLQRNKSGDPEVDALGGTGLLGQVFFACRHFGTGVILSTAFIHLLSHAQLYFANECVGELEFEAVAGAIAMASIWLVFIIDFFLLKKLRSRSLALRAAGSAAAGSPGEDEGKGLSSSSSQVESIPSLPTLAQRQAAQLQRWDILTLEAGIIFHSVLIGVTLGAATGSGWIALFIAIVFHQLFEGLALGSRIALLPQFNTSTLVKVAMGLAFVLTTPVGIAIGIGVRNHFNTNSSDTLIAMGTLHAISAGILIYTALVELLSGDFIHNPHMLNASSSRAVAAIAFITFGAAAMSVLGKWA